MKGEARPTGGDPETTKATSDESLESADGETQEESSGKASDKGKGAEAGEDRSEESGDEETVNATGQQPEPYRAEVSSRVAQDKGKSELDDLREVEVEGIGGKVYETKDKKHIVVGLTDLRKQKIESLIGQLGLDKKIKLPKDWDGRHFSQKRQWLKEKGVDILTFAGGNGEGEGEEWLEELPKADEVSTALAKYIREIERRSKGAGSAQDEYRRLDDLENLLSEAVLKGELAEDDAQVEDVRSKLESRLSSLIGKRVQEQTGLSSMGREYAPRFDPEFEIPTKTAVEALLNLAKEGKTSGAEWDAALGKIDESIKEIEEAVKVANKPSGFKKAYFVSKGIEGALYENEALMGLLPGDVKNSLESVFEQNNGLLAQLDKKFNSKFNMMDKKKQHALIGDIDSNSTTYLKMVSAGWGETLETAKAKLMNMIGEDNTGLREWRAFKQIEGLEQGVRVKQSTEVIPIWQEIPEKLTSVFSQMESMDFSVEELSAAANEAIALVRSIAPDTPEGRRLRDDLVDQLDAFRAFHSMRITMERNSMNPEKMLDVFQTYFDDDTWEKFAERFSHDDRFRKFVVKKEGEDGVEKLEGVNLFDLSFSSYSERLRQERVKMNMVEELTKHAIENPLGDAVIREIARSMNHSADDDFKAQLENLRQYFVKKTQGYIDDPKNEIGRRPVDEIWGRKNTINGKNGIKITQEIIQEWHQKQTLQGAFGYFEKGDVEFLAGGGIDLLDEGDNIRKILEKNKIDLATDEGRKEAEELLVGRSYLTLRQEGLKGDLAGQLSDLGLQVRPDKESKPIPVDIEALEKGGFLDSVNKNAYYTAWMFEWSNYDSIRIYSRDTKSGLDDDFESLVYHQSTNMFYGRHIDHIWEFYHDTNENRGRAKENDVNRIWKQALPGKHHYLFPQNSVMVRWTENFMSEEQKRERDRRAEEMMRNWDFDNAKYHDEFVSWMRNVVLMDMIENGEVSMSDKDNNVKFSEIMKKGKVKKFEMIDVFVDRNKHKEYTGHQGFQAYLANPTDTMFIDINNKTKVFYSTRAARQFPFMTLATRAHWDVNSKHRRRLFDSPNLTSTAGEHLVDTLQSRGDMERKQAEHEKRKMFGFKGVTIGGAMGVPKVGEFEVPSVFGAFLGTFPLRRTRQVLELGRRGTWEFKTVPLGALIAGLWGGFTEFLKQGVRQSSGGGRQ